jgi:citrate synthase
MDQLKEKFYVKSLEQRNEIKALLKESGQTKVDEVTLQQVFGGMRGIKSMLWETSQLDPVEGIRFRGYSIPDLKEKLPKYGNGTEPLPEGLFWLMMVGEIPTDAEVKWLSDEWMRRRNVPEQTYKVLDALSPDTHPMTQFTIAINSMQPQSIFRKKYAAGLSKLDLWDPTYEDTMNLIANLPIIAAYIYRRRNFDGDHIPADDSLDWAGNLAHMLGVSDSEDFKSFMRLYMTIHADHEGGNASAHTTHLIGSTLSDAYLSFAGGMNSLAGPLHGLANQEVIKWIFEMVKDLGTEDPTEEQIRQYVQDTLNSGMVIPGYGHAVLRRPDPRFMAQKRFAEEYFGTSDPIVNIVWKLFEIVPSVLQGLGKVKNPWPNVDAHSGAILVHYGFDQYQFYTVLFGVSRALGVLAAMCWSRAFGLPLERPKSVTYSWVKEYLKSKMMYA